MFFIGIFGIENKNKEIKTLNNIYCRHCNTNVTGKLVKNFFIFHFFFIPLIKWGVTYYIICDQCNTVYELSKEKGKSLENNESIELTSSDFNEVDSGNNNDYNNFSSDTQENGFTSTEDRKCPICGFNVDGSFKYCPKCGQRVR